LAYAACGYSRSKIVYFESLTEFWNMAGHGPYVWSCYGLFFSLLGINVWLARGQRLKALKQVKAFARRNQ
jgi:heme exporter protein D